MEKECQISKPDLDFKVELLKLRGYYLRCRKTEQKILQHLFLAFYLDLFLSALLAL